ncbi:multimerin-1 isoform X3 [Podarcis raffonei]|uniref:multimerin-1 isoform X3 n=1 Tax=Podarcis raffonei TaxID=65483 RepID=UPI0023295B81|nr:multimerin-1 isoform X3 [Podarcis raffonei]
MREVFLLLSLLALGCSSAEIEATSAPAVESEAESSHLGLTSPETQDLRNVLATSLPPTSEKPDALLNASQEEGEKQSSPLATKEAQGLQTTAEQKIPLALTVTPSPGNNSDGGSPNGKRFILPSNAGVPPPYHPWNRLPPKEVSEKNQGTTVSRSSRHSDDSSKQNADLKKPSFETTRGKNWCAYVHTRLQPTIVVDNIETYASGRAKPCTWIAGPCGSSSQSRTRQAYRVKHMIVTSLDWKCCPGYSGATCQPKAQEDQLLLHSNQAESNAAVGGGTPGSPEQQQQDPSDPAVAQKMNEQISSQEMRLTLLQKKVDNISAVVSDVSETLSSLEGKINEDKGRDFQAFLKDLKSKSIAELVKEIVREQVKASQSETQETVAQIFKITSGLSADLENIKQTIKSLNASHNKLAREIESRPTRIEILDIRTQILHIEEDISITCEKPIEDLQEHQRSIEAALEHQSSRSNVYYESLNRTLTQMKEVHEQLLTAERISDQNIPTAGNSITDNLTDYMVGLHEKVKTQSLMVLQLYDDLRVQDSKISNLTIALEIQRDNLHGECSSILSKCRRDFQTRLKGMEENMHSLNKSMENLVFPLDDKMDKMNEQINDLCYDMEILQPLIEQGVPFSLTSEYEQQIATEAISRKLENLTSVVAGLSSTTEELVKSKKELKDEAQAYNEISERRINECFILMEDGLNKTMMVINSAIDTIQDNYVLKETLSTMKNETKACCSSAEKMESILTLIPRFQEMNESLQVLVNENRKGVFTSNAIHSSSSSSGDLSIVRHNLNATLNLQEHHHDIGHLDGKGSGSTQEHEDYEGRLAAVEAKITKFLANNCVTVRNIKAASTEKDKVISLQVQALSSRIRALEAKSIRFSVTIPVLNKTAYEARSLCEVVSGSLKGMNASIPRLVKAAHPDNLLFQKGLQELTESMLEVKAGTILSNLTWYVDKSLDEAVDTITKRLKATPPVSKKPLPVKKIPVSTTANQAGRMQRNTDTASEAGDYLSCSSSPCQNGGTCVNERKSFVCACRYPFGGANCSTKMVAENAPTNIDFTKGSYRYAPMVAFFASHTYGMNTPGPIRYNNLDVNYGSSYVPANGRFRVPYLGIYVFEYTIESNSPLLSGYLVVDGIDKLGFRSENTKENKYLERVVTGDALLELNYGQEVWLRLATGSIPAKYPPVTTFTGYILYRT